MRKNQWTYVAWSLVALVGAGLVGCGKGIRRTAISSLQSASGQTMLIKDVTQTKVSDGNFQFDLKIEDGSSKLDFSFNAGLTGEASLNKNEGKTSYNIRIACGSGQTPACLDFVMLVTTSSEGKSLQSALLYRAFNSSLEDDVEDTVKFGMKIAQIDNGGFADAASAFAPLQQKIAVPADMQ